MGICRWLGLLFGKINEHVLLSLLCSDLAVDFCQRTLASRLGFGVPVVAVRTANNKASDGKDGDECANEQIKQGDNYSHDEEEYTKSVAAAAIISIAPHDFAVATLRYRLAFSLQRINLVLQLRYALLFGGRGRRVPDRVLGDVIEFLVSS